MVVNQTDRYCMLEQIVDILYLSIQRVFLRKNNILTYFLQGHDISCLKKKKYSEKDGISVNARFKRQMQTQYKITDKRH